MVVCLCVFSVSLLCIFFFSLLLPSCLLGGCCSRRLENAINYCRARQPGSSLNRSSQPSSSSSTSSSFLSSSSTSRQSLALSGEIEMGQAKEGGEIVKSEEGERIPSLGLLPRDSQGSTDSSQKKEEKDISSTTSSSPPSPSLVVDLSCLENVGKLMHSDEQFWNRRSGVLSFFFRCGDRHHVDLYVQEKSCVRIECH